MTIEFKNQYQEWDEHTTFLITMELNREKELGKGFNGLIGSARISVEDDIIIEGFYISDGFRNKGYGKKLMQYIDDYFTSRISSEGNKSKYLMVKQTNTPAIKLYESFGFILYKPSELEGYDWYYKTYLR